MKRRIALPVLVLMALMSGAARSEEEKDLRVPSSIEAVTVYLDRALITRKAVVQMGAGPRRLLFEGLPSEIEEASLRVSLSGAARLESLQARRVLLSERKPGAAQALEAELLALRDELQARQDALAALQSARTFLDSVQASRGERISKELGREEGSGPDVAKYREVLDFLTEGRLDLSARSRKAQAEAAALQPRIAAKQNELAQVLSESRLEQTEVAAAIAAEKAGSVEIRLSYMLPGALWFPLYDVRATASGGDLELAYFAMVQQATGEDWSDADLTLSAARPAQQVEPPELKPWYLKTSGARAQQDQAQPQEYSSWNPNSNLNFQYGKCSPSNKQAHQLLLENAFQTEAVAASVERRGTSAVFRVEGRHRVACNGKTHRLLLARADLPVARSYQAVPSRSLNTYVTGQVENRIGLPLLPGKAQVFLGGDLIGATSLDFTAPRESASIYLGVEEGVKVLRELDSRESGQAFLSSRRRLELAYLITVENLTAEPRALTLREALPVSQDERIQVRSRSVKPKPAEEERGILRWDLELKPGESRSLQVSYAVEYPEGLATPEVAELEKCVQKR